MCVIIYSVCTLYVITFLPLLHI